MIRIKNALRVLVVCLAGIFGFVSVALQNSQAADVVHFQSKSIDDLRAVLNSKDLDRIFEALNDVKRMPYKGEVLPYIVALWEQREEVDSSLNWQIVRLDVVRVELANILIQAIRNGLIDMGTGELHEFVRGHVISDDRALARNAILTLSIVNDPHDVPVLLDLAKRQHPMTFGAVVVSLSGMCNPAASHALDMLEDAIADEGPKGYLGGSRPIDFVRETRQASAPLREYHGVPCV